MANSLRRVDYLAYFGRDPRIAEALSRCRLAEEVDQYLLYGVRAASPAQSGQPPRSEPGRYDIQPPEVPDGWQAVAADRGILPNVGIFLLLALRAGAPPNQARRPADQRAGRGLRCVRMLTPGLLLPFAVIVLEYGLHER